MNYRDTLPDAGTRARYDERITAAARVYARWCLDDASGDADGEQAA